MINHFSTWFRIANAQCDHHHISVLSTIPLLRLTRHQIANQRNRLLFSAEWCFSVLVKIEEFLYRDVILGSFTTRNHTMCFGVILIFHCAGCTSTALRAAAPITAEILNYLFIFSCHTKSSIMMNINLKSPSVLGLLSSLSFYRVLFLSRSFETYIFIYICTILYIFVQYKVGIYT